MNEKELIKLIREGESETMEFKESLSDWREIIKTISAFSNTKGGVVLIGITDKGRIKGLQIGKKTLEDLANRIKENTDPKNYPKIRTEEINKKRIVVIEVEESKSKPVFAFDRVYKRVGKTNQKVSSEEIRNLAKESENIYWDGQICREANLDDVDWDFAEKKFIQLYETISKKKVAGKLKELLISLGCIEENSPTNAGILLFGKNPQRFFMNSYIALAKYKGIEVFGERLDYKEFRGNLFQQIDSCNNYLIEHTMLMSKLIPGEVRRREISEYGRFSVRELITNAVCHRNYEDQGSKVIIKIFDDKIEFYNLGGLPKWITPENIASEQYSRNPTIAKVLAKVEYIEELGEGWDKIIKEHKEHPLKPKMPKIKSTENSTLVTLFSTKEKFEERKHVLDERQEKIINYINKNGRITTEKCANLLNISTDTSLRELSRLKDLGLIDKRGIGRATYYVIR